MSLALSSLLGAIGRAGLRKEVGLLRAWATWPEGASAPNGMVKCAGGTEYPRRSTRDGVPEMVTPASRTTAVLLVCLTPASRTCTAVLLVCLNLTIGRQQFCSFV